MTRAAAGEVATARTMRQDPGPRSSSRGRGRSLGERFPVLFFRKRDVLLKLVYANLNLAWFSANLPHARQVCVLRHPCGQFDAGSGLAGSPGRSAVGEPPAGRGPPPAFRRADPLAPGASGSERARLWAATVASSTGRPGPPAAGSSSPTSGSAATRCHASRSSIAAWISTGAWRAERFLGAADTEDDRRTYSMSRPTAKQIDKWKQRLAARSIESCRRFVEPFGLPYYPGFEPRVEQPHWRSVECPT